MFYNKGGMDMAKQKLTYKVQRGDDYTKIADKLYGDKRYRTALKRQNPKVKKPRPGMVIDLLDDDPKEMWKKREHGRRRKTNLMRLDWENAKRRYGINPDLRDIEPITYTIQPQQPPPPEEPTPWWEDPAFQEGLIGLVEATAQNMGLDSNVMLDELGLGEGSPLLAEEPSTTQTQPQTGSPSSTTTMTDKQKKALKKELQKMGLDADVAMYELGLSDRDPYAWVTPQVTTQSSGATGGKTQGDTKDGPGSNIAETAQPKEPKPPKTPKDMVNLLDEVENEEELDQWREILSTMNFRKDVLNGLEHMASKKESELKKLDLLAYNPLKYYPEDLVARIKDEFPTNYGTPVNEIIARFRAWDLNLKGEVPDYRGIAIAEAFVPKVEIIGGVDATAVAAGIAVQSQWYWGLKDTKEGIVLKVHDFFTNETYGFGIAQMGDDEKRLLGLVGNVEDPDFAGEAMAARIDAALSKAFEHKFTEYTPQDKLIMAGLAQSGFFVKIEKDDETKEMIIEESDPTWGIKDIHPTSKEDDSPDWQRYYDPKDTPAQSSAGTALNREEKTDYQYSKQLMVILYIKDLRELHNRGWDLPFGLTEQDLDEVEEKVKNNFKDDEQ
jgi:hypothetical protein